VGAVYLAAGVFLIQNPLETAAGLTFLVAACLAVGSTLRIVLSVLERFSSWGWALRKGIVFPFLETPL
jgi:uncharacterized membrane protein HdeD (DUF308 family)